MRRSRVQLWLLLVGLAAAFGLLGFATVWQPPDRNEMGLHWQAFLARPDVLKALQLQADFRICPPSDCIAWSGLQEPDVARMTALAQAGQTDAVRLELILNRMPSERDIGSEDTVLCCAAIIKARPRRFLQLSRDVGLTSTQVVTASPLDRDDDYAGYDRELRARRAALAGVIDPALVPWRDRDVAALDVALTRNAVRLESLNSH